MALNKFIFSIAMAAPVFNYGCKQTYSADQITRLIQYSNGHKTSLLELCCLIQLFKWYPITGLKCPIFEWLDLKKHN